MEGTRPCGCKGCRTCLVCETQYGAKTKLFEKQLDKSKSYVYCPYCNAAWSGWDVPDIVGKHPNHTGRKITYPGVYIQLDFITPAEESLLMNNIDEMPWDTSQSGRRKQNFGPKTNFKKKKLLLGSFAGFPEFSRFIQERFETVALLKNYKTIEQCSLEYTEEKGASIDPHIDDCWIWGERIVTVNCLSDSVLTMTPYRGGANKYNLNDANLYTPVVNADGSLNHGLQKEESAYTACLPIDLPDIIVRIPMPKNKMFGDGLPQNGRQALSLYNEIVLNCWSKLGGIISPVNKTCKKLSHAKSAMGNFGRSLLVLYAEARYHWEHAVLRSDIHQRRVCIAYREFTPPYLSNGCHYDIGEIVLSRAQKYWDHKKIIKSLLSHEMS